MKRIFVMALLLFVNLSGATQAAELWRAKGLSAPESVVYDKAHHRLIVSNINGNPLDVDGNGYLSLLSMDGKTITQKWAVGMDAPKGMAIVGDRLYVADIKQFRVIDLNSGKITETIKLDDAIFLNDVAASSTGDVYVTDMMTNAIYRYHDGKIELWLKDDRLHMPNGVLVVGDHLLIGAWGINARKDFSTETLGGLLSVDIATKAITSVPQAERFGNIDGIVEVDNAFIVTDYLAGVIWRYPLGKAPEKMITLVPGSADLGTDGNILFIPMMMEGEVVALPAR